MNVHGPDTSVTLNSPPGPSMTHAVKYAITAVAALVAACWAADRIPWD